MAKKKTKKKKGDSQVSSTLARQADGTIQITVSIPAKRVKEAQEAALAELAREVEVPGFRKGKAPQEVAQKEINQQKLSERLLGKILPQAWTDAVQEHKLRPILSPRFELLSAEADKDWQIRATSCELPEINLGDYKKEIIGLARAKDIWLPGKQGEEKKEPTKAEKEQQVIKTLLEAIKVEIPKLLIQEEVNHRLSRLIEQTQNLGLTVEQYLASLGKSADQIKQEFAKQAQDSIKLELVLNAIAEKEGVRVSDSEIDQVVQTMGEGKPQEGIAEQQKLLIKGVLLRRKALDSLVALL